MMQKKKRYLPSVTVTLSAIAIMLAAKVIYDQEEVKVLRNEVMAQALLVENLAENVSTTNAALHTLASTVRDMQNLRHQTAHLTPREKECLHRNIYYEAGVEPFEGKIAVAQVTLNRLQTERWGSNLCNVIYSASQFSWTLDGSKRNRNARGKLWEDSKRALDAFLAGYRVQNLDNSLHYHATWMPRKPKWATRKVVVAEVGQHVFYKY